MNYLSVSGLSKSFGEFKLFQGVSFGLEKGQKIGLVAKNGAAVEAFDERPVALHMQGQEVEISIDVGLGNGTATIWTCDLTHGYITINGDYRS